MGTRGCKQGKFWSLWFSWFYLVWIFIFCLLAFYLTVWSFWKKSNFCVHFRHCTIFNKRRQIKLDRVRGKSTVGKWCFGGIVEFKVYVILVVQNLTPNVLVWAFVQFRPVWFFGVGTSPPDGLPLNKHQWREAVPKKKNNPEEEKTCMSFVRTKNSIFLLKSRVNWMCMPKWFLIASISIPNFASKSNYWPWHIFQFPVQQLFNCKI